MADVKSLEQIEGQIKEQMDRIYKLLDEKKDAEFIKMEYKRVVELISQKYLILQDNLNKQKSGLSEQDFNEQSDNIKAQYKEDVIGIAVAIDDTLAKQ
ncbi:hypothetical protein C0580_03300 [Candidatus Parcubacteria bacterium]|nr:MAG: hypothetical protein C0580_03300 [Candidatus Parcubacteria bacterium]